VRALVMRWVAMTAWRMVISSVGTLP
jgi:hypothetical protein